MVVGAQLSNENRSNADCTNPTQLWIQQPKCRCDCADSDHVTRGKCGETDTAVKWIKAMNAVPDQRRIGLRPCLWPCAAERKFEPTCKYNRKGQAHCGKNNSGLNFR